MHLIGGIVLMFLGYKILQRSLRVAAPPPLPLNDQFYTDMKSKLACNQALLDQITQGRKLDQQIVQDALNRETRAKTALIAVLSKSGVDEAGIQKVLAAIDNTDEGDGRFPTPSPTKWE